MQHKVLAAAESVAVLFEGNLKMVVNVETECIEKSLGELKNQQLDHILNVCSNLIPKPIEVATEIEIFQPEQNLQQGIEQKYQQKAIDLCTQSQTQISNSQRIREECDKLFIGALTDK